MKRIKNYTKYNKDLLKILTKIKSERLMEDFLCDLLTPSEYDNIVIRLQIIKQLNAGVPQLNIAHNLHTGIATVTRGSRELRGDGGFKQVLKLLKEHKL